MSSLANNDNSDFNGRDLEHHKKVTVSENKNLSNKIEQQYLSKDEEDFCNDVSTASYVRGYN